MSESENSEAPMSSSIPPSNLSISHKIITEFMTALKDVEDMNEVHERLSEVIFKEKPTEDEIRNALFGIIL